MTEKFKILAKYIKDISSETADIETYLFVKDHISKYQLNIDITSKALKNKLIEVYVTLKFEDKEANQKKSYFEIVYACVIKVDESIKDKKDLWMFAGMIIISANAGGAWSPMGDVTTIMLWVGGQVTAWNIIYSIFIPSLVCMIVPLLYISFKLKGSIQSPDLTSLNSEISSVNTYERNLIFYMGVLGLLFVPIFKITTGLPPYVGMLLSLGVLWVTTEILHRNKNYEQRRHLSVIGVLKKVDTPTIFFFLGILLAVAGLQSAGQLDIVAKYLENTFSGENKIYIINVLIGLMSALVDNVPLVAGAMGMYEIGPIQDGILAYPQDHKFWQFLAYCAGTGGSVLIIGSAAGVAVMGILKIDFMWYVKRISFLALIGYVAGAITYIIMQ